MVWIDNNNILLINISVGYVFMRTIQFELCISMYSLQQTYLFFNFVEKQSGDYFVKAVETAVATYA